MTLKLSAPNKLVGFVAEHLKSSGAGIGESRDPFRGHELLVLAMSNQDHLNSMFL